MLLNVSFLIVIVSSFVSEVRSYCWEPGRNPGFTGPPRVEQLDLATVRVSWEGLVTQRECADQFLVKYWQRSNPQSYLTSELLDKNANYIDVKVVPKIEYQFQAVAREDKGPIVGIDWNKSPLTDFRTSVFNKEIPKTPPPVEPPIILAPTSSSIQSSVDRDKGSATNQASGAAVPTSETSTKESSESILPMSIEVLAIVVVIGVAVLLVFVGVAYRLFCAKSGPVDEESCAGDDHDDDHDDDDDSDREEREHLDTTNSS